MNDMNWDLFWEREELEQSEDVNRSPPDPGYGERLDQLEEENIRLHNGLITLRDRLVAMEQRERERPRQEARTERLRQGRRGRVMGFLAGTALAWMVTALVCGGLLLGWRAIQWTAELLNISPLMMVGLMTLLLLGSLLLKENQTIADWFLEEDDSWDEEDEL